MALSGSVSTNKYTGNGFSMGMKCTWSATQSVSDNKSILTWTLASDGGAGFSAYTGNVSLTINGVPVLSIVSRFTMEGGGAWSRTGTLEIPHNSDGTKSFSISIVAGIWAYTSDNTKGSGTFELNQIPRKSLLSASNGTLGTEQILTVTRQANSFTHTITYTCGSESGTICEKSSNTSIRWTPPISLANQNKTGSSVSVTLTIETFSASASVGTNSTTITCAIPSSVAPSVTIEATDAKGYFERYGGYVQNRSRCRVELDASGMHGSSIKSYLISCAGQSASSRYATFELPVSGSVTITAIVTDSRGRTASASTTINVLPYSNPAVTAISAFRCDASGNANTGGSYMCVKFSASITPILDKNTARYSIKYKLASSDNWSTANTGASGYSPTNISTVIAADPSLSYDVKVTASDAFVSIDSPTLPVMSIYALMHLDKTNNRIGLGKVAEGTDILDVGLDARFRGVVTFDTPPSPVFGATDFVIAQGTSGGWQYRKWNSGFAECYVYVNVVPTNGTGRKYHTAALPFEFASADYYVGVTGVHNANPDYAHDFYASNSASNDGRSKSSVAISYTYSASTAYSVGFVIYIMGRWK